ncbi:MAG: glycoside hydrolase family 3 N-terminal domain-containing protein [Deltaproteobacteria bacterium]
MSDSMNRAGYRDAKRPVPERVADLLARMTIAEKVAQIGCIWSVALVEDEQFSTARAKAFVPDGTGQVTRIAAATGLRPRENAAFMNAIQRYLVEETRLGIPGLVHEESVGGFTARDADQLPQGIALAATWDPELVLQAGDLIRRQMLAVGARLTLAPVLDIARDPRWGRVEETYGEDAYLASRIGVAYVRGVQGSDLRSGVAATGKHFLGYGLSEGGHNHKPAHIGARDLREVYARPFLAAIQEAGLRSVMNAYNEVDGLPCGGSREILDDLLRGELGFDGLVVADYFTTNLLIDAHRVAADKAAAAKMALEAGLDVELPATDCYAELPRLIEEGALDTAVLDRSVKRVLALKFELGLFEEPYVDAAAADVPYQTPAARALARRLAAESIVLLTNDGILPLAPDTKKIAVIGPAADDERLLEGDYHYPAHLEIIYKQSEEDAGGILPRADEVAFAPGPFFPPMVTPLEGLRAALPDAEFLVAKGCEIVDPDPSGIEAAVQAAQQAEVALVFVGGRSGLVPGCTSGEFRDAASLSLSGAQQQLVEAVVATGTPTIVVLVGGRIFALPWIQENASAMVEAWLPGEEGGHGIADVLTGRVDASGRLPVTMPREVGQVPIYYSRKWETAKALGLFEADYVDAPATPLFPFGHGLSYAEFVRDDLTIEMHAPGAERVCTISCVVRNTSERDGIDVVQLYVQDLVAEVTRPIRQLVGFARVELAAGASRRVTFALHASQLAFHARDMRFLVEPGEFAVYVGSSAEDTSLEGRFVIAESAQELDAKQIVPTLVTLSD